MNARALLYSFSPKPDNIFIPKRTPSSGFRPISPIQFRVWIHNRGQYCCVVRVSGGRERRGRKVCADVKSETYELAEPVKEELEIVVEEVSWLEQFPKRWVIVILCFTAFLLCNMNRLDLRVNHTLIRDRFLWDLNNFESDPEEFAKTLCTDLGVHDPEVGPAIAFAIREQLYEIAVQNVALARESRLAKKGCRGMCY